MDKEGVMKIGQMGLNERQGQPEKQLSYQKDRGGRPPKPAEARKIKKLSITLTEEEFAAIREKCGRLLQPAVVAGKVLRQFGLFDSGVSINEVLKEES